MTSFASSLRYARYGSYRASGFSAGRLLDSRQRHTGMTSFTSPLRHVRVL